MIGFPRHEQYELWAVLPDHIRGVLLSVHENGLIRLGKNFNVSELKGSPRFKKLRRNPLIISLHPTCAWSCVVYIPHQEEYQTLPTDEREKILGSTLDKIMREYRGVAAKELGIHELDAVLADAYAGSFTPGAVFKKKKSSSRVPERSFICATFITRDAFDRLFPVMQAKKDVFITEAGRAEALALSHMLHDPIHYLSLHDSSSYLYRLSHDMPHPFTREPFQWKKHFPTTFLAKTWGLSNSISRALLARYYHQEFSSPWTHAFFEKTLLPAKKSFLDAVFIAKIKKRAMVKNASELPFHVPLKHGSVQLAAAPLREVLSSTRFSFSKESNQESLFSEIAPFLEYDEVQRQESFHEFLKRRIHWIFPS